jgi:hypothetical protein
MAQGVAKASERRFYIAVAISFGLLVFAGFSRTFYLHRLFRLPAPPPLIQVHGAIMTGWIVLFLAQVLLAANGRIAWHRRLGRVGAAYAALMIPIALAATFGASQREVRAHSQSILSQLNVLGLEVTQVLLFASFVGAAIWLRNKPSHHKRFMVLATLSILPNAIVRLTLLTNSPFFTTNLGILVLWALFVLAIVGMDSVRQRALHPAFAWGAPLAVMAVGTAWMVSRTAVWDDFWTRALS